MGKAAKPEVKKKKLEKVSFLKMLVDPPPLSHDKISPLSIKQSTIIDIFKGVTPLVILFVIFLHSRNPFNAHENPFAWTYFGCHGCYGLLWVGKTMAGFRDTRFVTYKPFYHNILTTFGLALYWAPIFILVRQEPNTRPPLFVIGISVMLFGLGVFWHFCSDIHKYVFLETREKLKKELGQDHPVIDQILKTKLWSFTRNPNYFGELLIYSSFCILPMHWIPFFWLACMISLMWLSGMYAKEESLSRFGSEWIDYKSKSWFFIPGIW